MFVASNRCRISPNLMAVTLAVFAARPATRSTLTFVKFLNRSANTTSPCRRLLGVFNPTDELIASEARDVAPRLKCGWMLQQGRAQVLRQLMHRTTLDPRRTHVSTVAAVSCARGTGVKSRGKWHRRID